MKYEKITRTVKVTDVKVLIVDELTETTNKVTVRVYGWIDSRIKAANAAKRALGKTVVLAVLNLERGTRTYEMSGQQFIEQAREVKCDNEAHFQSNN